MSSQRTIHADARSSNYARLSPKLIMQLAAPHTWPAAILPVLLSSVVALSHTHTLSLLMVLALLCICILMQAAVNTINDYYDFVKGTDTVENQDDPEDAVLVYNNIRPRSALYLALSFLAAALCIGVYVIVWAGWIPLVIGVIGAVIIFLYSAGKSPISYLPIGEFVSGFTMGGLIPLACYQALTTSFSWMMLLYSLPIMLGIGLIMFTNNTCDIEKDILAGRKTQSVLLGLVRARKTYHAVVLLWLLSIIVLVAFFYPHGSIVCIFMLLLMYPSLQAMFRNPLIPETRGQAMATCLTLNIGLGAFYAAAILFDSAGFLVL
ncbi:MAG: prenyltransferase [Raoultibacter sp.]